MSPSFLLFTYITENNVAFFCAIFSVLTLIHIYLLKKKRVSSRGVYFCHLKNICHFLIRTVDTIILYLYIL